MGGWPCVSWTLKYHYPWSCFAYLTVQLFWSSQLWTRGNTGHGASPLFLAFTRPVTRQGSGDPGRARRTIFPFSLGWALWLRRTVGPWALGARVAGLVAGVCGLRVVGRARAGLSRRLIPAGRLRRPGLSLRPHAACSASSAGASVPAARRPDRWALCLNLGQGHSQSGSLAGAAHLLNDNAGVLR